MSKFNKDLIIEIGASLEGLKLGLASARKIIRVTGGELGKELASKLDFGISKYKKDMANLAKSPLGLPQNFSKGFVDVNKEVRSFGKTVTTTFSSMINPAVNSSIKHMNQLGRSMAKQEKFAKNFFTPIGDVVKDLDKELGKNKIEFAGWAMSIMFFGMALKNTMSTIWRSSTKTFNDVIHSVEGSVTEFDKLTGSVDYLKFSVGAALEPLAGYLIPFVDIVSDLVQRFPKLTAAVVAGGFSLGTLFMVGGSGVLALNGFVELAAKMGLLTLEANKIKSYNWSAIGKTISSGIGIIAIGFAVEEAADAWKHFEDGEFGSALVSALSSGLKAYGGISMIRKGFNGKAGMFIVAGFALDMVEEGKLFQTINSVLGLAFSAIMTFMDQIKFEMDKGFKNMFIDSIYNAIKNMTGVLGGSLMDALGLADLRDKIKGAVGVDSTEFNFKDNFWKNYEKGMENSREFDKMIDTVLSGNIGDSYRAEKGAAGFINNDMFPQAQGQSKDELYNQLKQLIQSENNPFGLNLNVQTLAVNSNTPEELVDGLLLYTNTYK